MKYEIIENVPLKLYESVIDIGRDDINLPGPLVTMGLVILLLIIIGLVGV